jgi:hypothetical protein
MTGFLNKSSLALLGVFLLSSTALAASTDAAPRAIAPALGTEDSLDSTPVEVITEPPPGNPQAAPVVQEIPAMQPIPVIQRSVPVRHAAPPVETAPAIAAPAVIAPPVAVSEAPVSGPSLAGFGIADAGSNGIPVNVWRNSTLASSQVLLGFMHSGIANPTVQDLVTTLLATQATPPAGAADDWFVARIQALLALGRDDKADAMIASVPPSMDSGSLLQLHVELMLIRGDYDNACKQPHPDVGVGAPSSAFWQKMNIICQARAGKQNEAMVGIDVLREQNQLGNDFFAEAIRKIGDKSAMITTFPDTWTLTDVALMRLAGDTDVLKEHLDALPPVALKYLAQDASLDIPFRERVTGKARQLGLLPTQDADKLPEQPFAKPLASDVATLVRALGSGKPANADDDAVIARLDLDDGSLLDSRRIERLLSLMEPFGYKVPPAIWQKLFTHKSRFDGDVPPAMLIAGLNDAAQTGRKGDVIVLAGLVLGSADTDRASDLALLPVVRALQAAGFEKEARSVAYSAVKSYSDR